MTESQHQNLIFRWSRQPKIREKWPELTMLFHIKNETRGGAQQVAIDRSIGVKKGVPDLCLPVARGGFHGLYIELKTERGRMSEAQKWWGERLTAQGYKFVCCHGWKQTVAEIEAYMEEEKT